MGCPSRYVNINHWNRKTQAQSISIGLENRYPGGYACLSGAAGAADPHRKAPPLPADPTPAAPDPAVDGAVAFYRELTVTRFGTALEATAAQLRRIADELDRLRADIPRVGTTPRWATYTAMASEAVHARDWGIANSGMGAVVTAAAEADVAKTSGIKTAGTSKS